MSSPTPPQELDAQSWSWFARRAGIQGREKLLVALSGGADSVYLLQLLARAEPRPALRVVHVQHGLRGADSRADEAFCAALCAQLGIPFRCERVDLDPASPSLEERARKARYAALRREAERSGHHTILTAHQSQDVLETLLWRWIRGSSSMGVRGPARRLLLNRSPGGPQLLVLRPLLDLPREELLRQLGQAGLAWREDLSNLDPRFTRNRLRQGFMPFLERLAGPSLCADWTRFASSMERFEAHLEQRSRTLQWTPAPQLPHRLERARLTSLTPAVQRRALWRLLSEVLGSGPRGALLERILEDLQQGALSRHTLARNWQLRLGREFIELEAT